jgi:uncharacterized membrane protein
MNASTRKTIYTTVAGLVPLLVALGFFTDEVGQAVLNLVASGLTVATALLARKNVAK